MKKIIWVIIVSLSLSMLSCSSVHTFVNKDINPKGKIAVIIGETDYKTEHTYIASDLSNLLGVRTKLTVLSQEKVKTVLGSYPERIRGPYKLTGLKLEKDYTRHDLEKLAAVAKTLKVEYIYVFWIPLSIHYKNLPVGGARPSAEPENITYHYIGELIEFPSRRIIAQGYTEFAFYNKSEIKGLSNIEEVCAALSEIVIKEITDNTGIGK